MKPVNLYNWIGSAAVVLLFSMTSSCTDEDIQRSYTATDGIAFTPSIETRSWSTGDGTTTRTTVPVTRHSVMKLNNAQGGRDLYLHTTETDSIAAPLANDTAHIATRGAVVTTDNFGDVYEGFGVLAYAYQGEWDGTQSPNYIDNEQATKTGETYGFNPVRVWPGNAYQMAFFAYAPYDETGKIFNETTGAPTLAYTVPTDITKQNDLLACWQTDISGDKREAQQLKFSHLCTAVKFKVGDGLENAVTSISIQNVYGSGTYSVDDAKWTTTGEANGTYTFAIEEEETPADAELTNGESVFMMIPQKLPEDAIIEVNYKSEGGQEKKCTAGIGGKEWQKGHTVVYTLSKTEIIETAHFTVEAAVSEIDHSGGTLTYKVTSYTETSGDGAVATTPTAWKITGYQENGSSDWSTDAPDWITKIIENGEGSTLPKRLNATIAEQQASVTSNPRNEALKNAEPVSGIYDLSTQGGNTASMNTANCYVISAPGKYSLPLVYGNAIKDGKTNTSAYKSPYTGSRLLTDFINHTGKAITDPYIYNNENCTPDNATLVWQDSPNLVTNVDLSADNHSLTFEVSKENIAQGNAVVAVRNSSNTIMWSWHIWVTNEGWDEPKTVTYKSSKYKIMPLTLGWCENGVNSYEGRSVKVCFEQEGTGKTQIIKFVQKGGTVSVGGNAPFYRWGRKDPMLPAANATTNKTWYNANGNASTSLTVRTWNIGTPSITNGIQNPNYFCLTTENDKYCNLWAIDNPETNDKFILKYTKSVYDPCPVGYKVPIPRVFKGLINSGNSDKDIVSADGANGKWSQEPAGWNFTCEDGSTVFFQALGYRTDQDRKGTLTNVDKRGYYWAAVSYMWGIGYNLYFESDRIYASSKPNGEDNVCYPVHPYKDE